MNPWFESPEAHKFIPRTWDKACHIVAPARTLRNTKRPSQKAGGNPQGELIGSAVSMQLIRTKQGLNPAGSVSFLLTLDCRVDP